jgi:hypothetical protein
MLAVVIWKPTNCSIEWPAGIVMLVVTDLVHESLVSMALASLLFQPWEALNQPTVTPTLVAVPLVVVRVADLDDVAVRSLVTVRDAEDGACQTMESSDDAQTFVDSLLIVVQA